MYCETCKKHIDEGRFCPDCGSRLVEDPKPNPQDSLGSIGLNLGDANAISGGLSVSTSHSTDQSHTDNSMHTDNSVHTDSSVHNVSNVFSKKGIRNSQSNMQTFSISPQDRIKILSLQIRRDGTCVKKYFSLLAQSYT